MTRARAWRTFVEQRRRELHANYPCAVPTLRRSCPKHRARIPQQMTVRRRDPATGEPYSAQVPLSGICHQCRTELYQQLAAEYAALKNRAAA
jgi:hypothetical protein